MRRETQNHLARILSVADSYDWTAGRYLRHAIGAEHKERRPRPGSRGPSAPQLVARLATEEFANGYLTEHAGREVALSSLYGLTAGLLRFRLFGAEVARCAKAQPDRRLPVLDDVLAMAVSTEKERTADLAEIMASIG